MTPALRSTLSLVALLLAASVSSRAELTLVTRTDGEKAAVPLASLDVRSSHDQGAGPWVRGSTKQHVEIEGDVLADADLGVWAPRGYSIVRCLEEEMHANPKAVANATADISYHVKSAITPPSINLLDSLWPERQASPVLLLMAWVVHGKVTHLQAEPDFANEPLYFGFREYLTADDLGGQPVLFLWCNGHFVRPMPRFKDAAEQRASMACVLDDDAALQRELAAGVSPNATDSEGYALLHYAVKSDAARCAALLLKARARINGNDKTDTPLVWAAGLGRMAAMEALLAKRPWLDAQRDDGPTPLIAASKAGQTEAVRRLIRAKVDVDATDDHHEAPITSALDAGYADIARVLLDHYATFEFHSDQNEAAFITQCRLGHTEIVRLYLEHKVSANTSAEGFDALGAASIRGSADLVKLLIAAKAKVNAVSGQGFTPLMIATMAGNETVVRTLLDAKADPSIRSKKGGATPLHTAAGNDRVDIIRDLLAAGAPIDAKANDGLTPLEIALISHARNAAAFLVEHGATVDVKGRLANAVIEAAIEMDLAPVVQKAITDGWRADSVLGGGWPAVRIAEVCRSADCERVLRAACGKDLPPAPYEVVPKNELDAPLRVLEAGDLTDPRDPLENFPRQKVLVTAVVTPAGTLAFPQIQNVPDSRLTQQVLISLQGWRLTPPRRNAKWVGVRVSVPIEFPGSNEREYSTAQVDEMPRPVKKVNPDVPYPLQRLATSGEVDVACVVDVNGHPQNVHVVRASIPEWGPAAVDALKDWVFVPGKVAGRPVPVQMMQPFILTFY